MARYVHKRLNDSKFAHNWEGLHIIKDDYNTSYFQIAKPKSEYSYRSLMKKWLKLYFSFKS